MNIFLLPYNLLRHFAVGAYCAGAALLAWWLLLVWMVSVGPSWSSVWDGAVLLSVIGGVVAYASVMAEYSLRRKTWWKTLVFPLMALGISGGLTWALYWLWLGVIAPGIEAPLIEFLMTKTGFMANQVNPEAEKTSKAVAILASAITEDVNDPSLVSLRYRIGAFVLGGVATSIGPIIVRKFEGIVSHFIAGVTSGLVAGGVWHICSTSISSDLYWSAAFAAASWGLVFGLFAWGLPDDLYAGWIRVLTHTRFGHRIPVDALDGQPKERFVGHFPRGLDLFLPSEEGVLEMHVSVAVDKKQRYVARGLTLAPTFMRRFLESVDLRYDPRRSAPLETKITSGDRLILGEGENAPEIEFIMLPREER